MEQNQWTKQEWNLIRRKLEQLDEDTLAFLVKKLGIEFTGGIEALKDRKGLSRKEQLILVLDEVDRDDLEKEYNLLKK